MTDEIYGNLAYPGVYDDENKIIPYSPRKRFGFVSSTYETTNDKVIDLESMKNMSIDQIVELYKNGYRMSDASPTIMTAQGISISTGALLLIIGSIGLIWYLKSKGKI